MYKAEGDKIYVEQDGMKALFLTVHPTDTGGTSNTEEQAKVIAAMLNEMTY